MDQQNINPISQQQIQPVQPPSTPVQQPPLAQPEGKNKKILLGILIAIGIVLVIGMGILIFFLYRMSQSPLIKGSEKVSEEIEKRINESIPADPNAIRNKEDLKKALQKIKSINPETLKSDIEEIEKSMNQFSQ